MAVPFTVLKTIDSIQKELQELKLSSRETAFDDSAVLSKVEALMSSESTKLTQSFEGRLASTEASLQNLLKKVDSADFSGAVSKLETHVKSLEDRLKKLEDVKESKTDKLSKLEDQVKKLAAKIE